MNLQLLGCYLNIRGLDILPTRDFFYCGKIHAKIQSFNYATSSARCPAITNLHSKTYHPNWNSVLLIQSFPIPPSIRPLVSFVLPSPLSRIIQYLSSVCALFYLRELDFMYTF